MAGPPLLVVAEGSVLSTEVARGLPPRSCVCEFVCVCVIVIVDVFEAQAKAGRCICTHHALH